MREVLMHNPGIATVLGNMITFIYDIAGNVYLYIDADVAGTSGAYYGAASYATQSLVNRNTYVAICLQHTTITQIVEVGNGITIRYAYMTSDPAPPYSAHVTPISTKTEESSEMFRRIDLIVVSKILDLFFPPSQSIDTESCTNDPEEF